MWLRYARVVTAFSQKLQTRFYIFGGRDANGAALNQLLYLELATVTWTQVAIAGPWPAAREYVDLAFSFFFFFGLVLVSLMKKPGAWRGGVLLSLESIWFTYTAGDRFLVVPLPSMICGDSTSTHCNGVS